MKALALALLLVSSQLALADPQTGLWWNPSESGRGYAIDVQAEKFNVATFAYDASGHMQWYYTSGSTQSGGTRISGRLLKFDRGEPLNGSYIAPSLIGDDGIITIDFTSHDKGVVTLPGGRRVDIQRQNFGVGPPPTSLLGDWIYVYSIGSRASTWVERYNYTTVASATSTGTGVVIDSFQYGAAEYQISGSLAGYVVAFQFTPGGQVLNQYVFQQEIEEGRGNWVSPVTYNMYGMNAYRIGSPGGTYKSEVAGITSADEAFKSGPSTSRISTAVSLDDVSGMNPEMATLGREMWNALLSKLN